MKNKMYHCIRVISSFTRSRRTFLFYFSFIIIFSHHPVIFPDTSRTCPPCWLNEKRTRTSHDRESCWPTSNLVSRLISPLVPPTPYLFPTQSVIMRSFSYLGFDEKRGNRLGFNGKEFLRIITFFFFLIKKKGKKKHIWAHS